MLQRRDEGVEVGRMGVGAGARRDARQEERGCVGGERVEGRAGRRRRQMDVRGED